MSSRREASSFLEVAKGDRVTDKKIARRVWAAFCLMSLAALVAIGGLLWRASDDQNRIQQLQAQSTCRSELAAALDVAAGDVQLSVSRLVTALARHTPFDQTVAELEADADALQAALDMRAQTKAICTTPREEP